MKTVVSGASAPVTPYPLEFSDFEESLRILGFWFFLASDVVLFAALFSVYTVDSGRLVNGPTPAQLFHYGPLILETVVLLTSSFTIGLAVFYLRQNRLRGVTAWLGVTVGLGLVFVTVEFLEFAKDVSMGVTWHKSAFISAFFTLVGTHGGHVSFGIVWALALWVQMGRRGLTARTARKLYTFALYWHFLDVVWVFIFTVVYLAGKIS